jgi:hypothetical protein
MKVQRVADQLVVQHLFAKSMEDEENKVYRE